MIRKERKGGRKRRNKRTSSYTKSKNAPFLRRLIETLEQSRYNQEYRITSRDDG